MRGERLDSAAPGVQPPAIDGRDEEGTSATRLFSARADSGSGGRGGRPGLARAVGALRHRDFTLFYLALLVGALGGQLQSFANILQIYELTGSALHLGLTGLARGVPTIVLSLVGGIVADRVDRLRFTMVTQALTGLLSVGLAALTVSGHVAVWHIYLVIFIGGVLTAVNTPARSAIIPNLVPRTDLLNAIALNSTVWQTSRIVGPMLASLSVATFGFAAADLWDGPGAATEDQTRVLTWGFTITYLINGLLHLLTLGALAVIRTSPGPARSRQSPLTGLVEGVAFVRERSVILVLLLMDAAQTIFGAYVVLLPILADHLGVGVTGLGLLMAAPGVGSLVGAAIVMVLGDIRYKGVVVAAAILAYCGAVVGLAVSPWFSVSLAIVFLLGLFDSLQATPRNGLIQLITPDQLRGRVSAFQHMMTTGMPAVGQVQSGALASLVGAPLALAMGAGVCTAIILGFMVARPELRAAEIEAERPAPQRLP